MFWKTAICLLTGLGLGVAVPMNVSLEEKTPVVQPTMTVHAYGIQDASGIMGEGCRWRFESGTLYLEGGTLPNYNGDYNQDFEVPASPLISAVSQATGQSIRVVESSIRQIEFTGNVVAGKDSRALFAGFRFLNYIHGLSYLDTSQVENMSYFFAKEWNFTYPDLTSLNTQNVTDMSYMFWDNVAEGPNLDLSSFDTRKVTNMKGMFNTCHFDDTWNLTSFNTQNVTTMEGMFERSLGGHLDLKNFDTQNVTNMANMFRSTDVTGTDFSNFNTEKVTTTKGMFADGRSTQLDFSNHQFPHVTTMAGMFANNHDLQQLNVDYLTKIGAASGGVDLSQMFALNENMTQLTLKGLDTSHAITLAGLFKEDSSLADLDVSGLETANVKDMSQIFEGLTSMDQLDLSNFDTGQVTDMSEMFAGLTSMSQLNLSNFDTSQVANMARMFWGCWSLAKLDLSSFDTSQVTNMSQMFAVLGVKALDLSHFKTEKVIDMTNMFSIDDATLEEMGVTPEQLPTKIENLNLAGIDTRNADTTKMLSNLCNLKKLTLGPKVQFVTHQNPDLAELTANETYTGKWRSTAGGPGITSSALVQNYATAGQPVTTYVWQAVGDPEEPVKPVDPEEPVDPDQPVDPEKPINPGTPVVPDTPGISQQPVLPVTPDFNVAVSQQDQPVAQKRVIAIKKIGFYRTPTFTKQSRMVWFKRQPQMKQPQFKVLGNATSKQGNPRYRVRDVNRYSSTYRQVGYITTRSDYVQSAYYAHSGQTGVVTVINPKGVNGCQRVMLSGKIQHYRQGQQLNVKRVTRQGQTTRFQLTNGQFITGNKQLVQVGKRWIPRRVTVRRHINRYSTVNFKHRNGRYPVRRVLKVLGWNYTQNGTLRYRVAGGYITANPTYVR